MTEIKILYAIGDFVSEGAALVNEELRKAGFSVVEHQVNERKPGVENFMAGHAGQDNIVVFMSHYMDERAPFTIEDLLRYQNLIPNIRLILILGDTEKGSEFLRNLANGGFYLGIYENEVDEESLAALVRNGRNAAEARRYYGVEKAGAVRAVYTPERALEYVLHDTNGTPVERLLYIKQNMGSVEYSELVRSLPDEIKEILSADERFRPYLAAYIAAKDTEALQAAAEAELERRKREEAESELRVQLGMKNAAVKMLQRVVIGVAGARPYAGCTHQALLFANYLSALKFSVALVEYSGMEHKSFQKIAEKYGVPEKPVFTLNNVDYYPDFPLEKLVELRNYNFIVIDFGVFYSDMTVEFDRTVVPVVVSGGGAWEEGHLQRVFAMADKRQMQSYNYLFLSASQARKKEITRDMMPLEGVFFGDYEPDVFSGSGAGAIHQILSDFILDGKQIPPRHTAQTSGLKKAVGGIKEKAVNFFK